MTTFQLHRDKPLTKNAQKTFLEKIGQHWFKIILAVFALHIIFNKDVNISVNFSDKNRKEVADLNQVQKLPASFHLETPTVTEPVNEGRKSTKEVVTASMASIPMPKKAEKVCLLYTSPSPRDQRGSRMPSSA